MMIPVRAVHVLRTAIVYQNGVLADDVNVTPRNNGVFTFSEESHHPASAVNYDRNKFPVNNVNFNIIHIAESGTV